MYLTLQATVTRVPVVYISCNLLIQATVMRWPVVYIYILPIQATVTRLFIINSTFS